MYAIKKMAKISLSLLQNFSVGSTDMYTVSNLLQFDMEHTNTKWCTMPGEERSRPSQGVKKYRTSTKRTARSQCQTSCKTADVRPPRFLRHHLFPEWWIISSAVSPMQRCPATSLIFELSLPPLHRDYYQIQHGDPENQGVSQVSCDMRLWLNLSKPSKLLQRQSIMLMPRHYQPWQRVTVSESQLQMTYIVATDQ